MGKCVSKDQQLHIKAIGGTSYIAISDEFEYYHNNEVGGLLELLSMIILRALWILDTMFVIMSFERWHCCGYYVSIHWSILVNGELEE